MFAPKILLVGSLKERMEIFKKNFKNLLTNRASCDIIKVPKEKEVKQK